MIGQTGQSICFFRRLGGGKQLVKTIGTKGVAGEDDKHFNRPTYLAWLPDGSMFVADGYNGHRVVKFDKAGANPLYLVGKPFYSVWK